MSDHEENFAKALADGWISSALNPVEPIPDGRAIISWTSGSENTIVYFKDIHHWSRKSWGIIVVWKDRSQDWWPWPKIYTIKVIGNSKEYQDLKKEYDRLRAIEDSCQSDSCLYYGSLRELDGESS